MTWVISVITRAVTALEVAIEVAAMSLPTIEVKDKVRAAEFAASTSPVVMSDATVSVHAVFGLRGLLFAVKIRDARLVAELSNLTVKMVVPHPSIETVGAVELSWKPGSVAVRTSQTNTGKFGVKLIFTEAAACS